MDCKEGREVQNNSNRDSSSVVVVGQSVWDSVRVGSFLSLEGDLPGISAFWVMCDAAEELTCLEESVASVSRNCLFSWSARISTDGQSDGRRDHHVYLKRAGRRAGLKKFPSMPFVESLYGRYLNFGSDCHEEIEPLLRRTSGYAIGIGYSDTASESWVGAAQLMESHFSLSFDFENTIELESLRSRLVALYVSVAVEMDIMPVIPLNRHPTAGHVIFCRANAYRSVAERLAEPFTMLDGDAGLPKLTAFLGGGGGLAYL
ncbi:hypothetical protein [Streptomyces sp. YIM S03343]